jgi:hypothetical protein
LGHPQGARLALWVAQEYRTVLMTAVVSHWLARHWERVWDAVLEKQGGFVPGQRQAHLELSTSHKQ